MARFPRVTSAGIPHHVTQRGNAQRTTFNCDADRLVYLQLLAQNCTLHEVSVAGYCLMSNHIHLIAVPARADSLPLALRDAHGRYAAYFNSRYATSGHVWQGRYYSCLLDSPHLWAALRYVEMNPVRAGLTARPEDYPWSSAAPHCGCDRDDSLLDWRLWRGAWTAGEWRDFLGAAAEEEAAEIRRQTHTGRPLGSSEFVRSLERTLKRTLVSGHGGRPRKQRDEGMQQSLALGASENP